MFREGMPQPQPDKKGLRPSDTADIDRVVEQGLPKDPGPKGDPGIKGKAQEVSVPEPEARRAEALGTIAAMQDEVRRRIEGFESVIGKDDEFEAIFSETLTFIDNIARVAAEAGMNTDNDPEGIYPWIDAQRATLDRLGQVHDARRAQQAESGPTAQAA